MPHSRHSARKTWLGTHYPKLIGALVALTIVAGAGYVFTRKTPQDHFQAGIDLQKKGDLKGAVIELKNVLQTEPSNAQARYLLGQIHFANGDPLNAEKEFAKSRELGVKEGDLGPLFARTLLLLNQPKRVLDEVNVQEGAPPEANAAILALRARAQYMLNDAEASQKSLTEADEKFRDHPETLVTRAYLAFSQGRAEEALGLTNQALALAQAERRADFWIVKANLLQNLKRADEALQAYAKALSFEPGNITARLASAQLHLQANALDKAEAELKALSKYAPDNQISRYMEALVAYRRGKHAESYGKLQDVLRTNPSAFQPNLLAGIVSLSLNKPEQARTHLSKVLQIDPQHAQARKLMAAILANLGNMDEAKKILDSFQKTGNDPSLNMLYGNIALRQGHFVEARKYLESVPEDARGNARYMAELAISRSGSGDEAGATEALEKAAEMDTRSTTPEVLLVLSHLKAKRFDAAADAVDKLERERPKDPLIPHLRGGIHLAKQERDKARASFAKALAMQPGYFPSAFSLAQMDILGNDVKSARNRLEEVLKHAPSESRAWVALATLDAKQNNEAGFLKNLEQAKKADSRNPQARLMLTRYWLGKKDAGKALAEAREALDVTKQPSFNESIGMALMLQGDQVNALAAFKRWVESSPQNPLAHFRQAQAHLNLKEPDAALKSLDKALALRANFPEAQFSKALALGKTGQTADAIKVARALQASAPKSAAGYVAEGEVLLGAKKPLDAAKYFVSAARAADQGQFLGRAYQAYAAANQAGEGKKQFELWLKSHPNDAFVRHQLAGILLTSRQLQEAAEHYRLLAGANPKDIAAHNNLAWILGELKDPQAISIAEQALKLNPDNASVQDTLGWILINQGQAQRGIDILTKAAAKSPNSPEIQWHLAAALAKNGDRAKARQELERLLERGQKFPQESEARKLLESIK